MYVRVDNQILRPTHEGFESNSTGRMTLKDLLFFIVAPALVLVVISYTKSK